MNNFKATVRTVLKKTLGISFRFIPLVKRAMQQGLTVFLFHEVTNQPSQFSEEFGLAVSTQTFKRQMLWIQKYFKIIHPFDILYDNPLPGGAAIISFDDGFLSTFQNGLPILEKMGVPAIVFLNMRAILEQRPILSSIACYLNRYVPAFSAFSKSVGLSPPFHLTLSPSILNAFEGYYGPINKDAVLDYQGKFADLNTVKAWNNKDVVVYGNHLFEHWNASSLSIEEFEEQYKRNEIALSQLENSVNLFSFTNGQLGTAFSEREVAFLKLLGTGKLFSGVPVLNRDAKKYLLGRVSLSERDKDEDHLWFRIGQAVFNDLLHGQS
jgi:peptidoglycan/xylan/chitin deacetylase (PgdA/CDA1 family)